jgi:site-specific DNA recombinase
VQVCGAILGERGLPVGEVHIDDGRSAWNPRVHRPGWEALMARLESGAAGGVIVFDLERFTRQPEAEGGRLIAAAERGLIVLDSDAGVRPTTASGKKSFRDAMAAAAYYSDRLHDRTTRGKRLKALAGQADGRRSFGFEQDGVTIREDEAEVLRECAVRLLAGDTQASVMADLQARSVATVRGSDWGYTNLRQLMLRPRNIGLLVHNGEIVRPIRTVDGEPIKPILDETTYHRLVALYATRRRGRPPSGRYVLTGFAFCGLCDGKLAGRPVSGTNRRHYWCKTCRKISVDARRLDDWAGDWVITTLSDPAHAEAIERADRELEARRATLLAEQADIEATLLEIGARLGRREISLARHDAICGLLETRQAEIADELAGLVPEIPEPPPTGKRNPITPADYAYLTLLEQWTEGSPADQRALVARALRGRKLVIGPGKTQSSTRNGCRSGYWPAWAAWLRFEISLRTTR